MPEEPPKAPQLRISFGHAGDGGSQILSPEAAARPKEVITPAVRPIVHRTEQAGTPAKLSQALRERIVVIVKEVIALNKMEASAKDSPSTGSAAPSTAGSWLRKTPVYRG